MFDFEKLDVYVKAKAYDRLMFKLFREDKSLDYALRNQLRRASLSVVLNIAEGTSRFSKKDRRNFFVISRGSVFECVAILDTLKDENRISQEFYADLYLKSEEISKILYKMIRNLELEISS
jgi:four helix bundle protein